MGQLAQRIAHLTARYGSDPAAWQHEVSALAALEERDLKAALERFYALKRRLAEFRRAQLLRELKAFPFVVDVPPGDARGYPLQEIEADIRDATRALGHARRIARAIEEEREARASLRLRELPPAPPLPSARWDSLGALADDAEALRRSAMREARLERRLAELASRARRLRLASVPAPDPALKAEALDAALDACEEALARAERLEEAHARALAPLRAPDVATYRHDRRRRIEREAKEAAARGDVAALDALAARAEALRQEAAALASQAARARRSGRGAPEGERRPSDGIDPYG